MRTTIEVTMSILIPDTYWSLEVAIIFVMVKEEL